MQQIVVAPRFTGPPESGNGGYTCGLVAGATGLAHPEVTLRRPPPLDVPLRVAGTEVYDGDALVATAADAPPTTEAAEPAFPGYDAARAAQARYRGLRDHPFPTCFVCGPDHPDGLHLAPGPVTDGLVAGTWTPTPDLAGDDGLLRTEFVWAALDCPGAWALLQTEEAPIVLGRFAVRVDRAARAGETYVVTGWRAAPRDGRKHYAGTALHDAAGALVARGRATWVTLPPQSGAR